eukprot:TRINITY_DN5221_c4_g1_i1.p1 TRINITY_DN5221_c4_g1~~TRINITY_DN5221_c4_g1_i1.p1  ORF type:complete len:249 (+),score=64.25 TRINITY_DN5221_c4_g1_i1:86-832(+)
MSDELNPVKEDVETETNLVMQYSSLSNILRQQASQSEDEDEEEDEEDEEDESGDDSEDALGGTQKYSSLRKMMREDPDKVGGPSPETHDFLDHNNNTTNISNSRLPNISNHSIPADFPSSSDEATSSLDDAVIPDPQDFHSYDPGTTVRLHDKDTVMNALNHYWCPSIEVLCGKDGVVVRNQPESDSSSLKLLFVKFEVKMAKGDDITFLKVSHTFPETVVSFVSAPDTPTLKPKQHVSGGTSEVDIS